MEAVALRDWLAENGWDDVFLDLDPERGVAAGERWERALHAAATRCEAVVFVVTRRWLASGWCRKEYALARGLNKKLFAVVVDPDLRIDDLPLELRGTWQIVDLGGGEMQIFRTVLPGSLEEKHVALSREGLRRLKRGLEKAGLDAKFFAWPPANEPERAPYRGLKPLEAEDAGVFFGREAPIVEATDRLRGLSAGAPPRLLVILGASGAGKSSFLRAGLLPRLARDDRAFMPLPVVRPGGAALYGETGLLRALEGAFPEKTRAELRAALQSGVGPLLQLFSAKVAAAMAARVGEDDHGKAPAIVIAVDQAEELFRAEGAAESTKLLELLRALTLLETPKVIVLFAIRSDSYDALEHAKALEGLPQSALPLLPMPRGAYKEVIEGPARRVVEAGRKLEIEPQLTQRLLDDLEQGGADALPLLAFMLEQLYLDYHKVGVLRLADYEAFGGFKGGIDAAVERAFARADRDPRIPRERSARETLLRRGLIPWLAGVDPVTKSPRRNIARKTDIPAEAAPLIDLLVEERLLTTSMREEKGASGAAEWIATIEPTHETLLRQWGLLQGWLEQDFALLAALEGVKRAARDWDASGREEAWAAHGGSRLAEADALDARKDVAAKLDVVDRAYLAACRAKEQAAIEQERALHAAEMRAAQRTRLGLAAVSLVSLIAIGAAVFGFRQAHVATEQKSVADRSKLEAEQRSSVLAASVARSLTDEGALDPSLLLMLDAARVFDDASAPDEIRIALTRALEKKAMIETRRLFPNMQVFETKDALLLVDPATNDIWTLTASIDAQRLLKGAPGERPIVKASLAARGREFIIVRDDFQVERVNATTGERRIVGKLPEPPKTPGETYTSDETDVSITEDGVVARQFNIQRDDKDSSHQQLDYYIQLLDSENGRLSEGKFKGDTVLRKAASGGFYAADYDNNIFEEKPGPSGFVATKLKLKEPDAARISLGDCLASMPPQTREITLKDYKEYIHKSSATFSCRQFGDKYLFRFTSIGSGGEFPEDILIRRSGKKINIRETLLNLAPGNVPDSNISWTGARDDSERVAVVINRNVYVIDLERYEGEDADTARNRNSWNLIFSYRHPTMVEYARMIGPGRLAIVEATTGRITVHDLDVTPQIGALSGEAKALLAACRT